MRSAVDQGPHVVVAQEVTNVGSDERVLLAGPKERVAPYRIFGACDQAFLTRSVKRGHYRGHRARRADTLQFVLPARTIAKKSFCMCARLEHQCWYLRLEHAPATS